MPPKAQAVSRTLTQADNGQTIDCTASLSLTVPIGLPAGFAVSIQLGAGVTVSVVSDGTALLNGATTTIARAVAANVWFAVGMRSTQDSYAVTGS